MLGWLSKLFQAKPPAPQPSHDFPSKVAGVSFKNSDRTSRQKIIKEAGLYNGSGLGLGFEDDNKHDKNAVAVLLADGRQIGYLDARLASEVRQWHREGARVQVTVQEVTGGGKGEHYGVNIRVQVYDVPSG